MRHVSALALAFLTFNAWGSKPADAPLLATPPTYQVSGINGLYKFSSNQEVLPESVIINGELEPNIGGVSIGVSKDETVAIEFIENSQVLMTLRLADEEQGKVAEQMILSLEEFQGLGLKMVSTGNVQDLKDNYSGYIETAVAAGRGGRARARKHRYRQESSRRKKTSGGFRRDRNGRIAGGGGNCVSVVKSITGFRGTAGNGVGMANALSRLLGWSQISFSSRRRGTVCSWSGGFHGMGHVGWFDGNCFVPTYGGNCGQPGKSFRLKNCVHRG